MSKLIDSLSFYVASRAGKIETGGFWFGFIIPPANQAAYGGALPAPYFIVVALWAVFFAKIFIELFEKRLKKMGRTQLLCGHAGTVTKRLEAGLISFKAVGFCSVGLALGGLLTYLFLYVRNGQ